MIGLCVVCATTDLRNGKIYNVITFPSMLFGLIQSCVFHDEVTLASSIVGLTMGLVPFMLASFRGWIGAGDAKLLGAIGAIGGFPFIVYSIFYTFLFAGIYALLLLLWRGTLTALIVGLLRNAISRLLPSVCRKEIAVSEERLPLGIMILLGTITAIWRMRMLGSGS